MIFFPFSALTLSGDRKGIWPVKSWVLICWQRRFDWSFLRLIAPVADLCQVPNAQVRVPELQVQVQVRVPRSQVQVPITPDQVQPKYWSTDNGW